VDSHHRRGRLALLAATAIVAALTAVSGASAATTCTGSLPPGSYQSIVVPPGESCVLQASFGASIEVAGSISVGQGASLRMVASGAPCGQIVIHGSVAAVSPEEIDFFATTGCTIRVDGSISIRGASAKVILQGNISVGGSVALRGNAVDTFVQIVGSSIDGSLAVTNNRAGQFIDVSFNSIGGSLNFSNNDSAGVISVANNTIDGSLACSDNIALFGTLVPNTVGGSASGQCA
jgi:hypothetical protein